MPTGQQKFANRTIGPTRPSDRDFRIYFALNEDERTLKSVAEEFGLSVTRVWEVEAAVAEHLYQHNIHHARKLKQRLSTRLEWLMREAREAWLKSKAGQKSKTEIDGTEFGERGSKSKEETRKTLRESPGSNTYLKTMLDAHDRLCRLWGLDAATKFAIEKPDDDGREGGATPPTAIIDLAMRVLLKGAPPEMADVLKTIESRMVQDGEADLPESE